MVVRPIPRSSSLLGKVLVVDQRVEPLHPHRVYAGWGSLLDNPLFPHQDNQWEAASSGFISLVNDPSLSAYAVAASLGLGCNPRLARLDSLARSSSCETRRTEGETRTHVPIFAWRGALSCIRARDTKSRYGPFNCIQHDRNSYKPYGARFFGAYIRPAALTSRCGFGSLCIRAPVRLNLRDSAVAL